MNYIWGFMILIGIIYGTLTGRVNEVSDAVLNSSKEAVTLCITMLGVMGLWMGLMEIARDSGLIRSISRRIQPLIRFLFPRIPKGHPACEQITLNFVANFLGLGWAATPAGLAAMKELAVLEEERRQENEPKQNGQKQRRQKQNEPMQNKLMQNEQKHSKPNPLKSDRTKAMPRGMASNEMCTFLILNISSIQLIPVNVIAYRGQYGSADPTAIVAPGILATVISTAAAILFCKIADRQKYPYR